MVKISLFSLSYMSSSYEDSDDVVVEKVKVVFVLVVLRPCLSFLGKLSCTFHPVVAFIAPAERSALSRLTACQPLEQ